MVQWLQSWWQCPFKERHPQITVSAALTKRFKRVRAATFRREIYSRLSLSFTPYPLQLALPFSVPISLYALYENEEED